MKIKRVILVNVMGCLKLTYQSEKNPSNLHVMYRKGSSSRGYPEMKTSENPGVGYYPFGMIMPGRSYNPTSYKYGFGGQLADDEITGSRSHYTAMFWEYDSRLGRRWNPDPVIKPWESRYACFHNNPVYYTDVDGADPTKRAERYARRHGIENYSVSEGKNGTTWLNWGSSEDGVATVNAKAFNPNAVERFGRWFSGANVGYTGSGWGHGPRQWMAGKLGVNNDVNNVAGAGVLSQLQFSEGNITGQALDKVKQDPAMVQADEDLVNMLKSDPRYGNQNFSLNYKVPGGVEFGGKRASGDMWEQAKDPLNPKYRDTWNVAANELTWLLGHANVEAKVQVTANGVMNITYTVTDILDLRPHGNTAWGEDAYNDVTKVTGTLYHDVSGGNDQLQLKATWSVTR